MIWHSRDLPKIFSMLIACLNNGERFYAVTKKLLDGLCLLWRIVWASPLTNFDLGYIS